MPQLFSLGHVVMTSNLQRILDETDSEIAELLELIVRHAGGDWGDLVEEDLQTNARALKTGGRLFSAYTTSKGIRLWIITEADRSVTTALLLQDSFPSSVRWSACMIFAARLASKPWGGRRGVPVDAHSRPLLDDRRPGGRCAPVGPIGGLTKSCRWRADGGGGASATVAG